MTSLPSPILIAGPCAVESYDTCLQIGQHVKSLSEKLGFRYYFKASYRKANRSKLDSFSGIGDQEALEILQAVGKELSVPTITDVHESPDPARVAPYVSALQIPAFLCRQTSLLLAAGETGLPVNIKKGQFLSPEAMRFPLEKVRSTGNDQAWLCERGVSFGYQDLVVDATSVSRMKTLGAPVIMDCTHSVQRPNQSSGVTGGDPRLIEAVALSAAATGADGFFIKTHPNPAMALSDPYTMLPLEQIESILTKIIAVRKALQPSSPGN